MQCNEIESEVRDFLKSTFFLNERIDLQPEDSLLDKGIVDSNGIINVIDFIEERFEFVVGDREFTTVNFDSIRHIAEYVAKKVSEKSS
jgi:acyl carrier protein